MSDTHEKSSPIVAPHPPNTPMFAQYLEIKRQYPDALLFYRMGDFYEMFLDDAVTAAPVLEVQLTSRDRNAANPIPMCGVPHHSAQIYLQRLLAKGFKVAICEQMEDPAQAKGLVKRDVVRVLTPALIGDPDLVPEETTNYLLSVRDTENGIEAGLLDLLGGSLKSGRTSQLQALHDLFHELSPKEVLVDKATPRKKWFQDLVALFPEPLVTVREDYFDKGAEGALAAYLRETQKIAELPALETPQPLFDDTALRLDGVTLGSLAIVGGANPLVGESKTLIEILDSTSTPMGRRLLRSWITRPLTDPGRINARLDAVEHLAQSTPLSLSNIRDLERLTTKTALGLAMPRDLVTIRAILQAIPPIIEELRKRKPALLKEIAAKLDPLPELNELLEKALEDTPPATTRDGGIIRATYDPEVAELRTLSQDAKGTIAGMETRERERTGISSLKIKYSKVFGYTIEITKAHLEKVPRDYIRKQTIANGERFITEELKRFEERAVTAEQKLKALEDSLFRDIRGTVARCAPKLMLNAKLIAQLDVLQSFAATARSRGYCRPELHTGWDLEIIDGRHAILEALLPAGKFIPNSIQFIEDACRTLVITGPNMAGKSTIMRQIALISVMAHAGSFVPAKRARIPSIDAIYTRIGSSDDLAGGRSTFMVEMTEVARILEHASNRSLILIDEIGRGTSTYDGLSLAWSLVEHIHTRVQAKTLFATHFHEITALENLLPRLKNVNVLVERWKDEIVFLHKLGNGICPQSYGIEVAKLAGLPAHVVARAREILGALETQARKGDRARNRALSIHDNQMGFFEEPRAPENQAGLETQ